MLKFSLPFLSLLALLSGCGGPGGEIGIRESGTSGSATVAADYIPLAECTKDALERKEWGYIRTTLAPTMSLLSHRNEAKLTALDGNGGMQYLIDIRDEGERSSVEVFAHHLGWMYSGQEMVDELVGVVKECAT
jgi:hypothetical protein